MVNKHIHELLENAENKLFFAEKELTRPFEDSVTFAVCHSSNHAIREYLVSIILYNYSLQYTEDEVIQDIFKKIENQNIEFLIKFASRLDQRIADLEISHIACSGLPKEFQADMYCIEVASVNKCAGTARELADIVNNYIYNTHQPKSNDDLRLLLGNFHN